MDNNEITKEIDIVTGDTTKTFNKAKDDDASLYEYAGGEECTVELSRSASAEYAAALRRMKWQSHKNTRFVVYIMFALILSVFSVYYTVMGTYYIAALAGIVGVFMLYMVLCGQRFFTVGMEPDENPDSGKVISVKFCENNVYIYDGKSLSTAEYAQVTSYKVTKKYIVFRIKGVKPYADGVIFSKSDIEEEKLSSLSALLENK